MATSEQSIDLTKEFSLLPAVYDILKSIEKTNDSQEVTRKVSLWCIFRLVIRLSLPAPPDQLTNLPFGPQFAPIHSTNFFTGIKPGDFTHQPETQQLNQRT